ncbi:MAG: glycosyltransferase family 1 protein [Cyclobacteriaceae bacterium]
MGNKKVIIIDIYFLYLAQTGIKTYIESLCDEIDLYQGDDFRFVVLPDREKVHQSNYFRGKTHKLKNWLFQIRYFFNKMVYLPLSTYWYGADLVFSPDFLAPIWGKGKKVTVIHDAFFWESPEHYHPLWLNFFLFLLQKCLDAGARVLTVSDYAKEKITEHINPARSIDVVYSGVSFLPQNNPVSTQSPLKSLYFLHVGVLEKRKNLVTLVEAFSLFIKRTDKDFSLVLVGQRGPRHTLDDYDSIITCIKANQLEGRVVLPGYLPRRKLIDYYRHAFAYVFPSLNEGFGLPILEAFSYRLPVIISNQGALKEVGGEAVLVSEDNTVEGLTRAMTKMVEDKTLRVQLAKLGKERLALFSRRKFFVSLQAYFNKVLDG